MNEEQEYIWKAVGWTPEDIHNLASSMLSSPEVKNMITMMENRLTQIVDPEERARWEAFIDGLRCVLNE